MKLFEILDERGMSCYRLSQLTGIDQATLSRMKNGTLDIEYFSLGKAFKIADVLEMSIEEIFKD